MANTNPIYKVTDTELTSIADAIREKTGLTVSLTYVDGFVSALSNYLASGKPYTLDNVINRDIVELEGSTSITSIPDYCFYRYSKLKRVTNENFPNCTAIGTNAFTNCSSLEIVDLQNCTFIGSQAFNSCTKLSKISLPNCVQCPTAFAFCSSLISVNLPMAISVSGAFSYCYNLVSVNLPAVKSVGYYTFYMCSTLTDVNLPVCSAIGTYAFYSCRSLSSINFTACSSVGDRAFMYCLNLQTVSLPMCSYIYNSAFNSCYNLMSVYLMSTSVVSLGGSSVFYSTPIGGYTASTGGAYGSVYVHSSLVTAYQSASYWSAISARIAGI